MVPKTIFIRLLIGSGNVCTAFSGLYHYLRGRSREEPVANLCFDKLLGHVIFGKVETLD